MAHKTRGTRTNYPSDLSDEEWAFCARYLTLMREDAPQWDYPLRATFDALRYMVRAGCPWRMMPNDLPPWYSVQQQAQRWMRAGCFEAMAQDLRKVLRLLAGRHTEPSAVILDGRTLQSTPESGARAGYDGHKRKKGSKVHAAVDTLGHTGYDLTHMRGTSSREDAASWVIRLDSKKDDFETLGEVHFPLHQVSWQKDGARLRMDV